jgi:hypothetical protein
MSYRTVILIIAVLGSTLDSHANEFFEKNIRPLLIKRCYECHSADAKKLKGGLYTDSLQGLLEGGENGPAIVPHKPDESLFIEAIRYGNVDMEMPPKKKLPDAEIKLLEQWVEMGAPWTAGEKSTVKRKAFDLEGRRDAHWCMQPLQKAPVPQIDWGRSPIDKFIAAKLHKEGLKPAAEADKATWLRRVHFDLTGLPPSPAQLDTFLADNAADAYEKVVDGLLASPHYGEKWARHWMDLVRYAESCGHEFDYPIPHATEYRDYLIRAFNADVPYDQFVREHLAGDLLKEPRRHPDESFNESIIGTGFWHLGEATHSPTDVSADEADRMDIQLDIVGKAFMGLTVSCARCHDHKFDAISTADYYSLTGFLQSSRRVEAGLDPGNRIGAAVDQLQKLADSAKTQMPKVSEADIAKYLRASHAAFQPEATPKDPPAAPTTDAPIVYEDFEGGDYEPWTRTGNCWSPKPTPGTLPGQQKVSGFAGKGMINTFHGGDKSTGTLTSPPFTVKHRFITFLIGGGNHKGQTCMNLIDGKTVLRTMTGKANEALHQDAWDVKDLVGRKLQLQIVDNAKGGWGHVNVDHIVFTNDKPKNVGKSTQSPAGTISEPLIAAVAKTHGVDSARLSKLVRFLESKAATDVTDPLYTWKAIAAKDRSKAPPDIAKELAHQAARLKTPEYTGDGVKLGDFNSDGWGDWIVTGEAFGPGPVQDGDIRLAGQARALHSGLADSGRYSNKLHGTLQSPTFALDPHTAVSMRIKGKGVKIRLIIDSYVMMDYNGLLFSVTKKNVDTKGQWQTMTINDGRYKGHRAWLEIIDKGDGEIMVDDVWLGPRPKDAPNATAAKIAGDTSIKSIDDLATAYANVANSADMRRALVEHGLLDVPADLKAQADKVQVPHPRYVQAMVDGTPEDAYVYIRGNHRSKGPTVPRQNLVAVSGGKQKAATSGSGRLQLADAILAADNPLPSRVMVNRLWHHIFGRGIVPTVDDFGNMGQPPSHPLLLDWLAADFAANGWSLKKILRQLVLTSTYRMQSTTTDDAARIAAIDPNNVLLHKMPMRRLNAEAVRDSLLATSGRLDRQLYGGSVPVYLNAFMQGRGRPRGGPLDGNGRRSIYISIRRNFLPAMLMTFDFPSPFAPMGRRTVSNVPAQALVMMNNPLVHEQAKRWGTEVAKLPDLDARLDAVFLTALCRKPTDAERARFKSFVDSMARDYNGNNAHADIWIDVCHTVYNMKEFILLK